MAQNLTVEAAHRDLAEMCVRGWVHALGCEYGALRALPDATENPESSSY